VIKGFNKIIDQSLQNVVEKINLKKDIEKKNRELIEKRQKRLDEI